MYEEISDNKLLRGLRDYVCKKNPAAGSYLKSILQCGSKIIPNENFVHLVANKTDARFYQTITCKNSWCCPVCSAKQMAKYAGEIACAIDAIDAWEHQSAFMMTLTIPHTSGMSCVEVTEILYKSWKDFVVGGNKLNKTRLTRGWADTDPFRNFCQEFNCHHRVRVGEYTHGKSGWHPHFHCLFWVDEHKLQKVADWEKILCDRWTEIVKRNTLKFWDSKEDSNAKNNFIRLQVMYRNLNEESKPLFISKTDEGKIIKQRSSQYICGWGADKELTGNFRKKATYEGHETPHQILERAFENNDSEAYELYLEYAYATRIKRHARINFSVHSGIKKIIASWKKTHDYIETFKKNITALQESRGKWRVVRSFSKEQWCAISTIDYEHNIKEQLLLAALQEDYDLIIDDILDKFKIPHLLEYPTMKEIRKVEDTLNGDLIVL